MITKLPPPKSSTRESPRGPRQWSALSLSTEWEPDFKGKVRLEPAGSRRESGEAAWALIQVPRRAARRDAFHCIRLDLGRPSDIPYAAGQFFEFQIPGSEETRVYSAATRHRPGEPLEFHVKRVPGGLGSNYMCSLRPGDRVVGSGPYGKMQMRDRSKNLLFVAGGSGMAPIKGLLEELFAVSYDYEAWFFYGARSVRDLYLVEYWREMERKHGNFHFIPSLSDRDPAEPWNGEEGYIADVAARHFERFDGMDAYLCGPPILIQTTLKVLYQGGLRSSNIFYDEF